MFKCAALGCVVRVTYRGQLCGMCAEQPQDDVDYADFSADNEDEDEWECAYPGRCLMPSMDHHRSECYTVEDAEAYYAKAEGINSTT